MNTERSMPSGLFDAPELAAYLNVKVSWVYAQCAQGLIPCTRVGRYLRFDLTKVLDSLEHESE